MLFWEEMRALTSAISCWKLVEQWRCKVWRYAAVCWE
jgi:hypothetical protein